MADIILNILNIFVRSYCMECAFLKIRKFFIAAKTLKSSSTESETEDFDEDEDFED